MKAIKLPINFYKTWFGKNFLTSQDITMPCL